MKTSVLGPFLGLSLALLCACPGEDNPAAADAGADAGIPLPACGVPAAAGLYVKSVSPADQEARTLRMMSMVVTLSGQTDCAANAAPKLTLWQGGQAIALGPASCGGNPTTFKFKPAQQLAYTTSYTLAVEGLVGPGGTAIPACQVTFTTKSKTVAVATGEGLSLSRDEDGTLWTWGDPLNAAIFHKADSTIPEKLDLGGKVVSMAVGYQFALAALEDGSVWTWGGNVNGECGRGTASGAALEPGKVTLPAGVQVVAVATGDSHALALRSDGKVMGWGKNGWGEAGSGDQATPQKDPVEIAGLSGVAALDGGANWSLALKTDGTVWAWGYNRGGQIGQPQPAANFYLTPTAVGAPGAKAIAAGMDQGYSIDQGGTLTSWGDTMSGELGNGVCHDGPRTPGAVTGLDQVVAVAAGSRFGVAARADGTMWAWGDNSSGIVGDGTTGVSTTCNQQFTDLNTQMAPKQVANLTEVVGVGAAWRQAIALKSDGTVWATGYNSNSKLGLAEDAAELGNTRVVAVYQQVPGL